MSEHELSDEAKAQIEASLEPGTFDLDAFVADEWEFPKFKATVYLDGKTAGEINELDERIKVLTPSQSLSKYRSLGDADTNEIEREQLMQQRAILVEKYKKSALTFTFQATESRREVHKRVEEMTLAKFPDEAEDYKKNPDDHPEISRYQGVLQILSVTQSIANHEGKLAARLPTVEELQKLVDERMEPTEMLLIQRNALMAMTGSDVMRRAADAGFPG